MALSTREMLLILRARDEMSRVLRGVATGFGDVDAAALKAARNQMAAGAALATLGVGIASAGVAGLNFLHDATQMAVEFERQVAKVRTQIDSNLKPSLQSIGEVTKRVAQEVAVPLSDMNETLFFIFSSMDVNLKEAEVLLKGFAKEAVAGQTDIQKAAKLSIAILNTFQLPVTELTRIQDVMFQVVRKGIISYEELSDTIGRALPATRRAGQSFEQLGGMIAFLTRNGMSAAMSATSAARAMEAFAHPKTVERMEQMGISVKDAAGNFKPLNEVITQLGKKLMGLPQPEKVGILQELFKSSGGTIQARRFFDTVLSGNAQLEQYNELVNAMVKSSGVFEEAYSEMAGTTASQSQVLKNQWETIKIEIGQALLPVLRRLIEALQTVLGWWNSLSEGQKNAIATTLALASAIAVVVGGITAAIGVFLMFSAAAAALGVSLGLIAAVVAAVVAAIVAIILIIKNWDKITRALGDAWNWLLNTVLKPAWNWIKKHFGEPLAKLWNDVKDSVVLAVKTVGDWVKRVWDQIVNWTKGLKDDVMSIVEPLVDGIVKAWDKIDDFLIPILKIMIGAFVGAWEIIKGIFEGAWKAISGVIEGIILVFEGIIDFIVGIFSGNWSRAWDGIVKVFEGVWKAIAGIFEGIWDVIVGIFDGAVEFFSTLFSEIGNAIKAAWEFVWELIKGIFDTMWRWLYNFFVEIPKDIALAVWDGVKAVGQAFYDVGEYIFKSVTGGFKDSGKNNFFPAVREALSTARALVDPEYAKFMESGRKLAQSFIDGWLGKKTSWIAEVKSALDYGLAEAKNKAGLFYDAGADIARQLGNGGNAQKHWLSGVYEGIADAVRRAGNPGVAWAYDVGAAITKALGNGANSQKHWLQSVFQSISNLIPQWKGPPEKDKVLLFDNGVLIMKGLGAGIKSQLGMIEGLLTGVTTRMSSATSQPRTAFGIPTEALSPARAGGAGTVQYVTVNTPEIVPQRDAAILGFELSRRVG